MKGNPTDISASATVRRRMILDFTRAVLAWLWLLVRDWLARQGLVLPAPSQPDRWMLAATTA